MQRVIDARGSSVAIAGISEVQFEALGVSGDKLRYEFRFGDGESAATPEARHVYRSAGTYTATVTITDAADHQVSATQAVEVRPLPDTWYHAAVNVASRRLEIRRLTLTSRDGNHISGTFAFGEETPRAFTGHISKDRAIEISIADGSRLDGIIPDGVPAVLPLNVEGGAADRQTLPFTPVTSQPSSAAPKAILKTKFPSGYEGWAIMGDTPVVFDASSSQGDSLSFFVEVGDGSIATEPTISRVFMKTGSLQPRLTVVDRFGRAASIAVPEFFVSSLTAWCGYPIGSWSVGSTTGGRAEVRHLWFTAHEGRTFTGIYRHPEGWNTPFSGSFGVDRTMQFELNDGTITFSGVETGDLEGPWRGYRPYFKLTLRGGSADGQTLTFVFYSSYC